METKGFYSIRNQYHHKQINMIKVLVALSDSFEYLYYGSTAGINIYQNYLSLQTSDSDD